jgi:hypothetical protein
VTANDIDSTAYSTERTHAVGFVVLAPSWCFSCCCAPWCCRSRRSS